MFTKSQKISKKCAVALLIVIGAVMAAAVIILTMPGSGFGITEIINVSDTDGREEYLRRLGWEIDPSSEQENDIVLPKEFDTVLDSYNEMQKLQGFDLREYRGMDCKQYIYTLTNYAGCDDTVCVTLYVRNGKVIAGDIHSARLDGFMHGIKLQ